MDGFQVNTVLAPRAVLQRLDAFGREWRESAQLPAVRAAGGYRLTVHIQPSRFRISLVVGRSNVTIVCTGFITSQTTGSRIVANFRLSRPNEIAFGVWAVAAIALAVGSGSVAVSVFALTTTTAMAALTWAFTSSQRLALKAVVMSAADSAEPAGISTALSNER